MSFQASSFTRLPKGSRVILSLAAFVVGSAALAQVPAPPTIDPMKEADAISAASTLDDNPDDLLLLQLACRAREL